MLQNIAIFKNIVSIIERQSWAQIRQRQQRNLTTVLWIRMDPVGSTSAPRNFI